MLPGYRTFVESHSVVAFEAGKVVKKIFG